MGCYRILSFRQDAFDEHRDEFWESGDSNVREVVDLYESLFGSLTKRRLILAVASGDSASLWLEMFSTVTGLDISPSMLAQGRENATRAEVSNADFQLSDGALINALRTSTS